jgi:hypothetical protein
MSGDPRASTMHDEALQRYMDSEKYRFDADVKRICRSHQNANAKLDELRHELARVNAEHLKFYRGLAMMRSAIGEPQGWLGDGGPLVGGAD